MPFTQQSCQSPCPTRLMCLLCDDWTIIFFSLWLRIDAHIRRKSKPVQMYAFTVMSGLLCLLGGLPVVNRRWKKYSSVCWDNWPSVWIITASYQPNVDKQNTAANNAIIKVLIFYLWHLFCYTVCLCFCFLSPCFRVSKYSVNSVSPSLFVYTLLHLL